MMTKSLSGKRQLIALESKVMKKYECEGRLVNLRIHQKKSTNYVQRFEKP